MSTEKTSRKLARWARWVCSRIPLIGWILRALAIAGLCAHRNEAGAIAGLVAALGCGRAKIAGRARAALGSLENQQAVDELCATWARTRAAELDQILADSGYVASRPPELRILTALRFHDTIELRDAADVPLIAACLDDSDGRVRAAASRSLGALPPGALQDALCDIAIRNPSAAAARLCIEHGFRPRDEEHAALMLFVTRQLDAYFAEDDRFDMLRREYDRADPVVQDHVMQVARSGDRRCLGFFGGRKRLSDCTEAEIRVAIDSGLEHNDWERLWRAFLQMPLKHGMPLIDRFRTSGWQPGSAREQSLFKEVLALSANGTSGAVAPEQAKASISVFQRWVDAGSSAELRRVTTGELVQKLGQVTPPEGVTIVAALAPRSDLDDAARETIEHHEHWLVRLAGYACGAVRTNLARDKVDDPVHWVRELAQASDVLEFWPVKATPTHLEQLGAAPAEAWTGKLGTARRLLRVLMAHRLDTAEWVESAVEAGEFAGEFAQADGFAPA
ncbi:MAG: hypothetical protein JW940_27245 [Polyangiaceae bacterium]|nr:hypothetical protein [Polyangiaceae bacterium]